MKHRGIIGSEDDYDAYVRACQERGDMVFAEPRMEALEQLDRMRSAESVEAELKKVRAIIEGVVQQ